MRRGIGSTYLRLARNKHHGVAKVAIARKLSIRLYWMLRSRQDYEQVKEHGSHAGQSVNPSGSDLRRSTTKTLDRADVVRDG